MIQRKQYPQKVHFVNSILSTIRLIAYPVVFFFFSRQGMERGGRKDIYIEAFPLNCQLINIISLYFCFTDRKGWSLMAFYYKLPLVRSPAIRPGHDPWPLAALPLALIRTLLSDTHLITRSGMNWTINTLIYSSTHILGRIGGVISYHSNCQYYPTLCSGWGKKQNKTEQKNKKAMPRYKQNHEDSTAGISASVTSWHRSLEAE